jgi:two-component system, OmpR family, sensor kinase
MSLFAKITLLFVLMLAAMSAIGWRNIQMEQQNNEAAIRDKLAKAGDLLVKTMISGKDETILPSELTGVALQHSELPKGGKTILNSKSLFAQTAVIENSGDYYLDIRYLDEGRTYKYDGVLKTDRSLWLFFALDIGALLVVYIVLLRFLSPLRRMSEAMGHVLDEDFKPLDIKSKDEIGSLWASFNDMSATLRKTLHEQEQFLIRAAHELRTPIAKARIAAQMDTGEYGALYQKVFRELDVFTDELLKAQKLKIGYSAVPNEKFWLETALTQALERLFIEDESEVSVVMQSNFEAVGSKEYAVIVIRNLIDNAIKYKTSGSVEIKIDKNILSVKNSFDKIFDDSTANGYGFGLSMCREIALNFGWGLTNSYDNNIVTFELRF